MSAPKAKGSAANGTKKSKPTPATDNYVVDVSSGGFGKPDKAAYDVEQERLKKEIVAVQAKLVRSCVATGRTLSLTIGIGCRQGKDQLFFEKRPW